MVLKDAHSADRLSLSLSPLLDVVLERDYPLTDSAAMWHLSLSNGGLLDPKDSKLGLKKNMRPKPKIHECKDVIGTHM